MKPLLLHHLVLGMAMLPSAAKEFANLNFDEGAISSEPIRKLQPVELVLPSWTAKVVTGGATGSFYHLNPGISHSVTVN